MKQGNSTAKITILTGFQKKKSDTTPDSQVEKNSYFLVKHIFIRNIKGLKNILITNQLYSVQWLPKYCLTSSIYFPETDC